MLHRRYRQKLKLARVAIRQLIWVGQLCDEYVFVRFGISRRNTYATTKRHERQRGTRGTRGYVPNALLPKQKLGRIPILNYICGRDGEFLRLYCAVSFLELGSHAVGGTSCCCLPDAGLRAFKADCRKPKLAGSSGCRARHAQFGEVRGQNQSI